MQTTDKRIDLLRGILRMAPGMKAQYYRDIAHVSDQDLADLEAEGLVILDLTTNGYYPAGHWALGEIGQRMIAPEDIPRINTSIPNVAARNGSLYIKSFSVHTR